MKDTMEPVMAPMMELMSPTRSVLQPLHKG